MFQVIEKYHPLALRLFLVSTHYRSPINHSSAQLETASDRLFYIYQVSQHDSLSLMRLFVSELLFFLLVLDCLLGMMADTVWLWRNLEQTWQRQYEGFDSICHRKLHQKISLWLCRFNVWWSAHTCCVGCSLRTPKNYQWSPAHSESINMLLNFYDMNILE